jgi:hypothetical protein
MEATMEYRNIDTDYVLYFVCKRYYCGQLNKDQVYWKLESEGYSKKEIDNAIYDYYLVYERTKGLEIGSIYLGIVVLSVYIIYFTIKDML